MLVSLQMLHIFLRNVKDLLDLLETDSDSKN